MSLLLVFFWGGKGSFSLAYFSWSDLPPIEISLLASSCLLIILSVIQRQVVRGLMVLQFWRKLLSGRKVFHLNTVYYETKTESTDATTWCTIIGKNKTMWFVCH